ncbi:MAG: lipopolysaccharide biosynthesis protein [Bacteroidales bacterium]|nr:lipopolysaccharide biosynthesis protein [Bacteroidales bacterium]
MGRIKEFTIETFFYGFANVFSRFFAMLLIPIFTGFLGKMDYANFVMLQSVFTFLTILLALNSGVFFYYYEYENRRYKKIVFSSWFYYQIFVAFGILILLFAFSPFINKIFVVNPENIVTLRWCVALLGVQLFPYIFNITNINLFRIDRKPKKVVGIVFFESLFMLILVYISLKFLNGGLVGVVLAQIVARSLIAIFYINITRFYWNIKYFSKKILQKILVFSWPFIVSGAFSILIINVDKFIGASVLSNKEDVAILALAMQLVIPIIVLADMIRMALGPYIMSIRKEKDMVETFQAVFDLSVFSGLVVLVIVVLASPFLTMLLADSTYIEAVKIIPLFALANVVSIASTQIAVNFSLTKKTIYILYSTIIGGIITILLNYLFLSKYGIIVSGITQILSYLVMSLFLYYLGKKLTDMKLNIRKSAVLLLFVVGFIIFIFYIFPFIKNGNYILLILASVFLLFVLLFIYLKQQKISLKQLLTAVISLFNKSKTQNV